jgi:hypothetical protein
MKGFGLGILLGLFLSPALEKTDESGKAAFWVRAFENR